ncbi:c-type cytochrome [bacterium]|nr:c-type cytochrome [bacterium]
MSLKNTGFAGFLILAFCCSACHKAREWDDTQWDNRLSGGSQTVFNSGIGAFSSPFNGMSPWLEANHELGDMHFEATFVPAPAQKFGGLGPVYNSNSCFNCHVNDGRGKPINPGETLKSMLIRLSVPGENEHGGPLAAPGFGGQLQDKAVFGIPAEAHVNVVWHETEVALSDGQSQMLRYPEWTLSEYYTNPPANMLLSARIAPPVHGLGLLELVDESTLLSFADENDLDGDGISGRPNYVFHDKSGQMMMGRFGWKAEAPTLEQQIAGAYNDDMGVTTSYYPNESSASQLQNDKLKDDPEVPDSVFHAVVFYVQSLAVPARRNSTNEQVLRGEQLFAQTGCAKCHIPTMRTGTQVVFKSASNQLIHPYTDMLLHDMGPALSDNRPSYKAEGSEWRTPPLWGIGLTETVNGHTNFLHDGRARNLLEAILWHGGEAQNSRDAVVKLSSSDRAALLAFLNSL